ncbi:BMP family lipoprotein [Jeotgalibacillus campisalis]|uniref:ABC transporter substrate-binding protein n=1 Tax=Jeotgalibacillus campisalis TaxID=220754 RepID=A0A0C2R9Z2_9BACL|nr:BMP family ABC transporter substrate-binding protein [Jeotgalibacillus campisalis]KIL47130.1 ABC transporter substrate-binding protein [Jeotgalibacillus campisalis]
MKILSWALSMSLFVTLLSGCQLDQPKAQSTSFEATIGILLSDTGLGDGSFNDAAFKGLERARNELGIRFDYREAPDGNYEEKLNELAAQDMDLIIGLGYSVQEALEKVAEENPEQSFLLIDGSSDVANVMSMTFKEHEASFLVGVVAAMTSKTGVIGFIGGMDAEVIHRFEAGYTAGALYADPDIKIIADYAGDFGDAKLGETLASEQINKNADFLYPAAGYTGIGAILKAQEEGIFAAGVDGDQFYVAEKAVVTSMMKNVDIAVYDLVEALVEGSDEKTDYKLGLAENGVTLAEVRLTELTVTQQAKLIDARKKIISGDIIVPDQLKRGN